MSLKFFDQLLANCITVIVIYFPFTNAACDTATLPFTKLSMAFQHVQGTAKTTSYAHILTTTQAFDGSTCSAINPSLVLEAPYGDCTVDCLTTIVPYRYSNGSSFVDIVMLKPDQVSLYPDYAAHDSKIYCATTSGYCGATVPLYNFVSTKYGDHYTSADKTISDPDYSLDNSGIPQCYGWSMPTQESDKYEQANYYSAADPPVCDVYIYFSLSRTTTMSSSSTASTTNTGSSSSVSSTVGSSTTMKSTTGVTTASTTVATTSAKASTTMDATTVKSTTAAATTSTPTTKIPATTTTLAPVPLTDSSGNLVTDSSGNTITVAPVTVPTNLVTDSNGIPVTDSSGNVITYPPAKDDSGKKKGGLPVWAWVVLGVGIGVLALAAIGMGIFVHSNFNSKPVHGRVNPYDRDLYTTDGMYDVPPVPVQTMPGAANVGAATAGHGANYAGIGVAESSVI